MAVSPLAPDPQFPESADRYFETAYAENTQRQGPLRFQEGVASDTDVPNDFAQGIDDGYRTAPGRMNHNANVFEKYPEQTLRERAHVGSASWPEAPTFISEMASGASGDGEVSFSSVRRDGQHQERVNYARVV